MSNHGTRSTTNGPTTNGPTAARVYAPTGDDGPWATGVASFAAMMLILVGVFQILQGIVGLVNDQIFVAIPAGYVFAFTTTTWGLIHLIIGLVNAIIGFSLFSGASWARWAGIGIASIGSVAACMWLPFFPVWALLTIGFNVAVIWALTKNPLQR
ncbi:MAG: hypothetical protein ABWX96_09850 [Propionibacteriaceae bacterium]